MNDTLIIVICIFLMSVIWSFYFKIKEGIENVDNYVMPISFSNNKSTNPSRDESKTINVPGQITSNGNLNLMKNTNIEGALNVKSNVDVNSGLLVKGNTTTNELKVNGNTNTNGLSVNGNTTTNGLSVNGNTTTNGLNVTGNLSVSTAMNVPGLKINNTANIKGIQMGRGSKNKGKISFNPEFPTNNVFVFCSRTQQEDGVMSNIVTHNISNKDFSYTQTGARQGSRYGYDYGYSGYEFNWVAFCVG